MELLETACRRSADPRRRAKNAERGRYAKGSQHRGPDAREARRRQLAKAFGVGSITKRQYNMITARAAELRRRMVR